MIENAIEILKEKQKPSSERLEALLQIVEMFESDYFPLFEEILQDTDEDPEIRSSVALALGKISGEKPFEILKPFSNDDNSTVRSYVIEALGMTRIEAAAPILIQALK